MPLLGSTTRQRYTQAQTCPKKSRKHYCAFTSELHVYLQRDLRVTKNMAANGGLTRQSHIYIYIYIYIYIADVRFISAARNEHGLIREQSAQTTTRMVGYIYIYIYIYGAHCYLRIT